MNTEKKMMILIGVMVLCICAGCAKSPSPVSYDANTDNTNVNTGNTGNTGTNTNAADSVNTGESNVNSGDHEDSEDYVWDGSKVIDIVFNGNTVGADSTGVTVSGSRVTIRSAGTYRFSGSLTDGQVIVDTDDKETVRLILNGVTISCSTSAPVYIKNADETIIILADNTRNYLTDGKSYILDNAAENEPNAVIFSMSDLTIYGNGSLTVNGNYADGITSKDGLILKSGTITVNSADDGIRGKDYLIVRGGNVTVNATGNGMLSDNELDASKGYISIESGTMTVTSGGDAVSAATDVIITDGKLVLTSGGGSGRTVATGVSAKGIKGVVSLTIDGGTFTINSADDALHSNNKVTIQNGTFSLATGDDGIHADSHVEINGGTITISKSYEGIESVALVINGGEIHITSSDDGLNGAGGNDSSGMNGMPGGDRFGSMGNASLSINGGYTAINALGDGIDINGAVTMTAGTLIVDGPTANFNGALDYDSSFKMTGGLLFATGSSGMAMAPDATSTQNSVLVLFRSIQQAGSIVHVQTADGKEVLSLKPVKQYQSIAFSLPELTRGSTYDIYTGGSSTGTVNDGLYRDGTYSPGTKYTSFTISGSVTRINR
jgi:hypothetical protein